MSELEDALRVIKEKCKSMENCSKCPLRSYDGDLCEVRKCIPGKWKIKSDELEEVPRIFV